MKRAFLGTVVVAAVLLSSAAVVLGQMNDQEKLKQGIALYDKQQYKSAIDVLTDIDVSNLETGDKNKPALYIKRAEEGLGKQSGSQDAILAGQDALKAKQYATAIKHFERARELDYLNEAQAARLASLTTLAQSEEVAARKDVVRALAEAKQADDAGQKAQAVKLYTAVTQADVNIPAADRNFAVSRLAALSGVAGTAAEAAPATVAQTSTDEQPETELKPVVTPTGIQPVAKPADEPVATVQPAETPVVAEPKAVEEPVVAEEPKPVVQPVEAPKPAEQPAEEPRVQEVTAVAVEPVVEPAAPATPVVESTATVETTTVEPAAPVQPAAPVVDQAAIAAQAKAAKIAQNLESADQAMDRAEYAKAKMYYSNVLADDPENALAARGLERAKSLMGEGPGSLIQRESDRIAIEIERTKAKVRNDLAKAQAIKDSAATTADYDEAMEYIRHASALINQNIYLSPETAENLREEAKNLAMSIDQARQAMIRQLESERQQQIVTREQERAIRDKEARVRQIESLWNSAKQNADRKQYQAAADILDQLLLVDPTNERARRFRDDYLYFAGVAKATQVRLDRKQESVASLVDVEESAIPYHDIHRYPSVEKWQELTEKRAKMVAASQGESEAAAETRRKLNTKGMVNGQSWSISLALTETALGNVLDFIAEAARAQPREINIIIDRKGITDQGISLDDPITLNVKDVSIAQALKMVLGDSLGYVIQDDGTVLVSSRDRINQDLPIRTYFVQDLITPIPDFGDTVPRFNLTSALNQAGQTGGGGGAGGGLFDETNLEEEQQSGTKRLQELIERTVRSTEPWESLGGRAALDFYERTGLMIVSQTADGHKKLNDLLTSLRRERAIMVAVESRFVTVADAFLNDVTLDFDVAWVNSGARFADRQWATLPSGQAAGTQYPTLPGPGTATVPGQWPGDPLGNNTGLINPTTPRATPVIMEQTSSNGFGTATLLPNLSNLNAIAGFPGFGANEGGMTLSGVFLDDVQVGFLLRAIQADRRTTTLFAPRITLWNGQRSWITDGTQQAYVSDLEPVVAEAAVGFDATIGVIVSGTVLDVKATVSADRRYVQLDLRPQVALLTALNTIAIQAAVPGAAATATIQLPVIRITDMRTSVSVPDGGTLLIGGQKIFEEHDVESGVPVLSKVPMLKRLFSNRAQIRGQENLLILVKPSIIIQSEKEAELGFDEIGG